MRRAAGLAVIVLLSCLLLQSQQTPKVEVFGGYALAIVDDRAPGFIPERFLHNGWTGAVNYNFSKNIGFVSDFGGYYGTHDFFLNVSVPSRLHTFMFGPQVSEQFKSFTPFGHFLIGVARVTDDFNPPPVAPFVSPPPPVSGKGFAFAFGGGVDTRISDLVAWRVQADYLNTSLFKQKWDNARFATGVVFRFGSR